MSLAFLSLCFVGNLLEDGCEIGLSLFASAVDLAEGFLVGVDLGVAAGLGALVFLLVLKEVTACKLLVKAS